MPKNIAFFCKEIILYCDEHPEVAVTNSLPPSETPKGTINSVVDLECKKAYSGAIVKAKCKKYNETNGRWESTDECKSTIVLNFKTSFDISKYYMNFAVIFSLLKFYPLLISKVYHEN